MQSTNRRAQIRKIKRDLTQTLNQLFAGKKPTAKEAQVALENVLRYYSLPARIGVRLNQVKDGTPPVLKLEIYDPVVEERAKLLEDPSRLLGKT